jgi:hypothetical protein
LHDSIKLENDGIVAVPVATTEFQTAARAQAAALGRPDLDALYVEHPIQDQTPAQIAQRADDIIERLVALLVE